MNKIQAPWTDAQVINLNNYQSSDLMHPFTGADGESLVASNAGWVARDGSTVVVLDWAWEEMADGRWVRDAVLPPEASGPLPIVESQFDIGPMNVMPVFPVAESKRVLVSTSCPKCTVSAMVVESRGWWRCVGCNVRRFRSQLLILGDRSALEEMCARVAVEADNAFCGQVDAPFIPHWGQLTMVDREAMRHLVACALAPKATAPDQHRAWVEAATKHGWIIEDSHCLVPWDQLDWVGQTRTVVFMNVVRAVAGTMLCFFPIDGSASDVGKDQDAV